MLQHDWNCGGRSKFLYSYYFQDSANNLISNPLKHFHLFFSRHLKSFERFSIVEEIILNFCFISSLRRTGILMIFSLTSESSVVFRKSSYGSLFCRRASRADSTHLINYLWLQCPNVSFSIRLSVSSFLCCWFQDVYCSLYVTEF